MENRFLKVSDYVINPAQITSVDVYPNGLSTVRFTDGRNLSLTKSETSSLMALLAPLGA